MADTYVNTAMASSHITSLMRRINALEAGVLLAGQQVLVYDGTGGTSIATTELRAFYQGLGLTVHTSFSGSASDYGLIFIVSNDSNPSFFSSIVSPTWNGLVVICGETGGSGTAYNTWINGLSGATSITIGATITPDPAPGATGSAESHLLTTGVTSISYGASSRVSGGTTLSKSETDAIAWMATTTNGTIKWVIAGDDDWISDAISNVALNEQFLENLFTYRSSASLSQTTFNSYTTTTATSLGTPDAGVSIPALAALTAANNNADLVPRHIIDMRDAIETLAPYFDNPATTNPYNWTAASSDNLFYVANGNRTEYGATGGAAYDWTRTEAAMEGDYAYSIDIGEVLNCIVQLEAS